MLRHVLSQATFGSWPKRPSRGADGKERRDAGGQWSGCSPRWGSDIWQTRPERRESSSPEYKNLLCGESSIQQQFKCQICFRIFSCQNPLKNLALAGELANCVSNNTRARNFSGYLEATPQFATEIFHREAWKDLPVVPTFFSNEQQWANAETFSGSLK